MSIASIMVNLAFKRSDKKRDAGLSTPEDIERFDNIVYGNDRKSQSLDVYRPKGDKGLLPVIVSVHGGGWVYGDKELYQYYCMNLAQRGFAVVNFTYRLAPRYKFPSSLEDTNTVFRWVLEHADEYGFDTQRIFAVGDSAGAHMLGLYCCMCTNPDYAASLPFKAPEGFVPRAVALNCGVYEVDIGKKGDLITMLMADLLPKKGSESELEQISVLRNVSSAFPPCFVMTANEDFLREGAPALCEKLKSLGVDAVYRMYGDEGNPLGHVFHCDIRSESAKQCNDDECEFFKSFR